MCINLYNFSLECTTLRDVTINRTKFRQLLLQAQITINFLTCFIINNSEYILFNINVFVFRTSLSG